jgi:signal transduction histidine kinase
LVRQRIAVVLTVSGATVGLLAQWVDSGFSAPHIAWIGDLGVGWVFIGCGVVGHLVRSNSRAGWLLMGTGFAWFIGSFAGLPAPAAWLALHGRFLYLGLLIHLVVSFPSGRLQSRADRLPVALGYLTGLAVPLAQHEWVAIVLGSVLAAAAVRGYLGTVGPARHGRAYGMRAAVAVAAVLIGSGAARLLSLGGEANIAVLWIAQVVFAGVAVGLTLGLVRGVGERVAVTDLVVEFAGRPRPTLQAALARALGDPTLQVGYVAEAGRYVDAAGRPLELPAADADRAITPIRLHDREVGVLVHDPSVMESADFADSVAAAAELMAANARLQGQVRTQIAEVAASRRRLIEAGAEERQRLSNRLREGVEDRLHDLATAFDALIGRAEGASGGMPEALEPLRKQLQQVLADLDNLGQGLHPPGLDRAGLSGALHELVQRCPLPVHLEADTVVVPPEVAAAAYFVAAEALANVTKHAEASAATLTLRLTPDRLSIMVVDDGVGGAELAAGSGLRGLVDRIEALGGSLWLESPHGAGTRLAAEVPLGGEAR